MKPGGRVYLDASAFREKYSKPTFVSLYIFPGDHAYFCLHAFLAEVAKSRMEVLEVYNDQYNYYLTYGPRIWMQHVMKSSAAGVKCFIVVFRCISGARPRPFSAAEWMRIGWFWSFLMTSQAHTLAKLLAPTEKWPTNRISPILK